MERDDENLTPDELAAQKPALLPDREAMSTLNPLPVEHPVEILPPDLAGGDPPDTAS